MFVRNCNTTKHKYDQCALLDSFDCVMRSFGNKSINLSNLDYFSELTARPKDWPGWLASKQKLLDELITDKDYDPWDPSQHRLKSRLRKSLLENYVNYNDYDPFDAPNFPKHASRKQKAPPITFGDDSSDTSPIHQQHANQLQELLNKLIAKEDYDPLDPSQCWLKSRLQKGLKDYVTDNDYNLFAVFDCPQQPRKRKAPPSHTTMTLFSLHLLEFSNRSTIV